MKMTWDKSSHKVDRYKFYNDKKHKRFNCKVKNKHQTVKGIVLINDHDVTWCSLQMEFIYSEHIEVYAFICDGEETSSR